MNEVTNQDGRRIDSGKLFWGFCLVGAGILFMLDQLGVGNVHDVARNYWPMFLVLLGLSKLLRWRSGRGRFGGLSLIAIGIWLQMVTLNVYGLTYESSWPILLIILGSVMVLRAVVDAVRGPRSGGKTNGGTS